MINMDPVFTVEDMEANASCWRRWKNRWDTEASLHDVGSFLHYYYTDLAVKAQVNSEEWMTRATAEVRKRRKSKATK